MTTREMVQIALDLAGLSELPQDSSVSVESDSVTNVLAGVDMGVSELLLARALGYDCVVRHHNMVPALGRLGDLVTRSHCEKMMKHNIPANIAQKLLARRKQETTILFHGTNLDGAPSCARLLRMPYLGLHTPADLLGERTVEAKVEALYRRKENPTVQDIMDCLLTIREYAQAPAGQEPQIWVGEAGSCAGKALVEFAGGLGLETDEYKAYIDAGIGTFICMHADKAVVEALKEDNRCNVLVMGHMSSDSIGMNRILDAWEDAGLRTTRIGGLVAPSAECNSPDLAR
ncbi:MAG: hypothetical protein LBO81_06680 [Clostridiales Family XIII bacterium]|nr:hypothetical protein [Clostridiales Family XIII bacterium]